MKKFGPCKILKKHDSENAYEVQLPDGIHISPIFNIADLTKYHDDGANEELMLEPCPIPTSKESRQRRFWIVMWVGVPEIGSMKSIWSSGKEG